MHQYPDSNAWAANGPKVAGGGTLLAGDPHLPLTLPSIWYQVAISAPGLSVTGVSVPGLPGILLGHNAHIAWSLTDVQNQSAFFYREQTSKARPGEYFWHGQWRRMRRLRYSVPVRGGATRQLTVDLTVHGPVLTQAGQTVSVDWIGAVPSPDLAVMYRIYQAGDFARFRAALASWRAPAQNFVYADDRGNIGAISAGYYPLVRHGDPWLPMPGTGADDLAGVIPYAAVPQVYDPPGHVVATANQRPVGPGYPYYIGTTANDFDPSYRAAAEYAYLGSRRHLTLAGFAGLQNSLTDELAGRIVPRLLAALRHAALTPVQQQAVRLLAGWHDQMAVSSPAASLWWTFWADYLSAVFRPWWSALKVPVHTDPFGLAISPQQFSLDEVLEAWTLRDCANQAFTPPGGAGQSGRPGGGAGAAGGAGRAGRAGGVGRAGRKHRDCAGAMRSAFATAVAGLHSQLGGSPAGWTWGRLHSRELISLTQASALGYGPKAAGGDPWTVDAAEGGMTSFVGPSWRMIVHWPGSGRPDGVGIFPGGQSENPASPWYQNLTGAWWAGKYLPLPPAGGYPSGPVRWVLAP